MHDFICKIHFTGFMNICVHFQRASLIMIFCKDEDHLFCCILILTPKGTMFFFFFLWILSVFLYILPLHSHNCIDKTVTYFPKWPM